MRRRKKTLRTARPAACRQEALDLDGEITLVEHPLALLGSGIQIAQFLGGLGLQVTILVSQCRVGGHWVWADPRTHESRRRLR